jgi:Lysine methyltransferase
MVAEDGDDDEALSFSGFDQLFVSKEYQNVSVSLGGVPEVTINVLASPQASTDYDLTGQILWPVSVLLARYIVHQLDNRTEEDALLATTVVELGAGGTAVPSFAASRSRMVKVVVATDGNDNVVWDLLERNVKNHDLSRRSHDMDGFVPCPVLALPCLWGNRSHVMDVLGAVHERSDVVVVAADVVQWPDVIDPLLHTVKALLWAADNGRFLLGIVNRAAQTYNLFFQKASSLGFRSQRIDFVDILFDGGEVPRDCLEGGGRETELYELTLVDWNEAPLLLTSRNSSEEGVESFPVLENEYAPSLPC